MQNVHKLEADVIDVAVGAFAQLAQDGTNGVLNVVDRREVVLVEFQNTLKSNVRGRFQKFAQKCARRYLPTR